MPGGIVEEGESLIEGLKRETLEETGIEVEVGQLFCISSNTDKYPGYNGVQEIPTKVMLDFICTEVGGEPRPSEENSQTVYVERGQALSKITAPAMIERFKAYLEYDGRPSYLAYVTKPAFRRI